MTNYNNGKIYKIEPINGDTGDIYIGSTTKEYLCQRMTSHRSDYKRWKDGKRKDRIMAFDLFDKYGIENCNILILEYVNANTKDELLAREKYYVNSMLCINKYSPLRTEDERIAQLSVLKKKNYEENRERYNENNKIYRLANKTNITALKKIYYEENKEKLLSKTKERYSCVCGSICGIYDKQKHFRSKKHIKFINII